MNAKPNILNRAYHYTRALSRWIKVGRPVRSEMEIERIFETCCKPCEAYDGSVCHHCGCRINKEKTAMLNKIAMATEECHLGKWNNENSKTERHKQT